MLITGKTKITGLFGWPVEHTLSPYMQNAAFLHCGLDYCYLPFLVSPDDLESAIKAIRSLNLCGVNLTVPHKEASMPFLDEADDEALAIGAVNAITNAHGILTGHNTDSSGFAAALQEQGITLAGCKALIIGAGGASRSIGYYLSRTVKSLHIYNRTHEKAVALASHLSRIGGNTDVIQNLSSLAQYDIIINATSLGLKKDDPLPLDINLLRPLQTVCDLIYRKTPLLVKAEQKGCRTTDGLGMLLWQGAYAFELWTGMPPPIEVMRTALLSIVK